MAKKLNLGCGPKILPEHENVDFYFEHPQVRKLDLSKFPWPWEDSSVDEIKMWDFLEHFSYHQTDQIIFECWRILKTKGFVDIQVPDFDVCACAVLGLTGFNCNQCGYDFDVGQTANVVTDSECPKCKQSMEGIRNAAMMRLYGGQKKLGDWHQFAFTHGTLTHRLQKCGFGEFDSLEETHQRLNWNFRLKAIKVDSDIWKV